MRPLVFIISLLFITAALTAGPSYKIKLKVEGFEEEQLKLGYHYGLKQYIQDSTMVDKSGWATFEGDEALKPGIYFAILGKQGYFEFLVTEEDQDFTIETNVENLIQDAEVKNSEENEAFYEYMKFISQKKKELVKLKEQETEEISEKDKEAINKKRSELDKEVKKFQEKFQKKRPNARYTKYLKYVEEPEIPESPKLADGTIDSTFRFRYYKEHYFDNIDFSDKLIARSPLVHTKVNHYIEKMTRPIPDSVNVSIDHVLNLAKDNEGVYQFLTAHLLNTYAKSKIMGMDAVYVHIVDNYYAAGETPWVDSTQLFKIKNRADLIRPNLIGKKGRNFKLKDAAGTYHTLSKIISPYVVLYFWDPDCGHCKKSTPKVIDFNENYKDKGVKVIAISTEHEEDKWRKYLEDNPTEILHLADLEYKSNFRRDYDISGTPRIFILDENKIIKAKRIGADQLPGFMDRLLANDKAEEKKKESQTKESQAKESQSKEKEGNSKVKENLKSNNK